jgi:uncharacterized protein YfaS (alpha-2-macroglobulin family)
VEVEVTADLLPNAFVSVLLTRGRSAKPRADKPNVGAPDFRIGYAEIAVNAEARRLAMKVTPSATELKPGSNVDVSILTTNAAG